MTFRSSLQVLAKAMNLSMSTPEDVACGLEALAAATVRDESPSEVDGGIDRPAKAQRIRLLAQAIRTYQAGVSQTIYQTPGVLEMLRGDTSQVA